MSDNEYETNDVEVDFLCDALKKVEIEEVTTKVVKNTKKIPPKKEVNGKKGKIIKDTKDEAWRHIFEELSYDEKSDLKITAEMIKTIGKKAPEHIKSQFEPRLLCYQDSGENRPNIFKEKDLCIIAIENGVYMIMKQNIYYRLSYETDKPIIPIKRNTEFDDVLELGNSENSLLDILLVSKVYEREELIGEELYPRSFMGGRHFTKTFDMMIGEKKLDIKSVQYETDGCCLSKNFVVLIECKNKKPESFNLRQFYYSYRSIYDNLVKRKSERKIVCLFIGADKGITYIWKFTFEDPKVMTSIKCHSLHRYSFVKE